MRNTAYLNAGRVLIWRIEGGKLIIKQLHTSKRKSTPAKLSSGMHQMNGGIDGEQTSE